jgi:hypothetical protein
VGPQGEQGIQGIQGNVGPQGEAGANGTDGVSVTNAEIVSGNLEITLSNATVIDAGTVSGGGVYGNAEVQAYLTSEGITAYGNTEVQAYLTSEGIEAYGNTEVQAYLTSEGIVAYGDSNVAAYTGNITATVNGFEIGYRNMPQVSAGNVTLALADNGKHYYSTSGAPTTITVPTNANVAFPVGSVITVVNQGTGNITVDKGDANVYLGGNATSASRTITTYGVATLLKVDTDSWFINGTGVI